MYLYISFSQNFYHNFCIPYINFHIIYIFLVSFILPPISCILYPLPTKLYHISNIMYPLISILCSTPPSCFNLFQVSCVFCLVFGILHANSYTSFLYPVFFILYILFCYLYTSLYNIYPIFLILYHLFCILYAFSNIPYFVLFIFYLSIFCILRRVSYILL